MEIVFLGTGTSQGVPMIAQPAGGCDLSDPRNWRTRASVHVVLDGHHIQVDAGPEFRLQCIQNQVTAVDTFVLTHGHADHVVGMDDLRRFCDLLGGAALPVYGTGEGLGRVKQIFPYAILDRPQVKGYPAFRLAEMPKVLEVPGGRVHCTLLPHGAVDVLGLVFEETSTGRRFAYYTDCSEVGEEARALAEGADVLVLDGLRPQPHPTHMTIDQAVEAAQTIGASRTLLTHMTFTVDHEETSKRLPPGVNLAYDGLRLALD
ncbi:MAG: MBL fold metallo-hydrolase [Opitutales bacterium]